MRAAPALAVDAQLRGARAAAWRFLLQRASAAVLALCVVVHLATIVYAVRHGLRADAIVARVQGSVFWPAFYGVFVVAVAIHAPLGLRAVAEEWLGFRGPLADLVLALIALGLLGGGFYAIATLVS
jgi:fumarate reductase subunit C